MDEAPQDIDDHDEDMNDSNAMDAADHSEVPRKRKAADVPPAIDGSDAGATGDNEAGPSEPKKPRMSSPKPMVTDEVEIEAKREVEASAGLQDAKVAGSRLELRHQVCP